jgi:hypothetical protein
MDQAPPETQPAEQHSEAHQYVESDRLADKQPSRDHRALKETVEMAASAYFEACRKIASTVNRLKQR